MNAEVKTLEYRPIKGEKNLVFNQEKLEDLTIKSDYKISSISVNNSLKRFTLHLKTRSTKPISIPSCKYLTLKNVCLDELDVTNYIFINLTNCNISQITSKNSDLEHITLINCKIEEYNCESQKCRSYTIKSRYEFKNFSDFILDPDTFNMDIKSDSVNLTGYFQSDSVQVFDNIEIYASKKLLAKISCKKLTTKFLEYDGRIINCSYKLDTDKEILNYSGNSLYLKNYTYDLNFALKELTLDGNFVDFEEGLECLELKNMSVDLETDVDTLKLSNFKGEICGNIKNLYLKNYKGDVYTEDVDYVQISRSDVNLKCDNIKRFFTIPKTRNFVNVTCSEIKRLEVDDSEVSITSNEIGSSKITHSKGTIKSDFGKLEAYYCELEIAGKIDDLCDQNSKILGEHGNKTEVYELFNDHINTDAEKIILRTCKIGNLVAPNLKRLIIINSEIIDYKIGNLEELEIYDSTFILDSAYNLKVVKFQSELMNYFGYPELPDVKYVKGYWWMKKDFPNSQFELNLK